MNGSNFLVVYICCWDQVASDVAGKLAGEAGYPLADDIGEVKLLFQTPALLRKYPLVEDFRRQP